ncbi:flagellar hook-basal body complex protein FliE [Mangrovimicrobium sediminis]|uniref:Flagellar hook-basal body complex protein FliE n=1 Tax=Mangrovimicrobium sediminis TaxID=2562682 RepID=A0A4Z0M0F7_9GAMM|nr:flagellar hook-basal body complex protein FliE [Haliea sp. SAOS-164]TGD73153.1 flagellar hook-basal body complex protein FliE [Haliea sp. SAOS-164]
MVSPVVQTALRQMQSLAAEASGGARTEQQLATSVGEGGFAEELRSSIVRINEMQQTARAEGRAFQAGDPGVSLDQVMVDSQKASIAFQTGVQVRNRLINAYKEIMNMQV